ncbi:MAG: hypothetical protein IH840_13260 [Candidatus Heimdallarchaeota archaeon]|nr:hypothetical protein [Candidatus Heimdallarchaeota archaeon]
MVKFPFELHSDYGLFTCVLLEPAGNTAYVGKSDGTVEIWNIAEQEKVTEVRYLTLNNFNEMIPIEDPVVNLAAPADFSYVYAFMGIAAYCIDTHLKQIVQQIPISEPIVCGAISPIKGEVSVLANTGYLSRWSPKFIERTGSIEFDKEFEYAYVCHHSDESKIILINPNGTVLLTNLTGERYTVSIDIPEAAELLESSWFDKNDKYQIYLDKAENIIVIDREDADVKLLDGYNILNHGKNASDAYLRQKVDEYDFTEQDKNYILDQRLSRHSKDRYSAEIDAINKPDIYQSTVSEDSKTLTFALEEFHQTDSMDRKSLSLSLIEKMADKHNVPPKYIDFAFRQRHLATDLLDRAKQYEIMWITRKNRMTQLRYLSLFFALIMLLLSIEVQFEGLAVFVFFVPVVVQMTLLVFWGKLNREPRFEDLNEFVGFKKFIWLNISLSIILMVHTSIFPILNIVLDRL